MKAVYIEDYGGRDKLIIGELPKPEPKEGEVLVRIRAAGVNPVDGKIREGRLKERMPNIFPIVLGWDMAGVVEERGFAARRFEVGDEVYGYCRRTVVHDGTYAEYIAIPECYLMRKPAEVSFEKAAAVPLTALTAYQGLFDRANLKKGETCVIVGASGGVGSFAVQFARLVGARVVAVASKKNHRYLKSLGADETVDYAATDFVSTIRKSLRRGADVVYAAVGGESLRKAYDLPRKDGRLVTIVEPGDPALAEQKGIKLLYHFVEPNSRQLGLFRWLIDKGRLKVQVSKVFPLEEVAQAQEMVDSSHTRGKIVLRIV